MNWDDLLAERTYSNFEAYKQSKLANILFTKELARRLAGTGVTIVALHPGFVATELFRDHGDRSWVGFFQHMFINSLWMFSKKASDGAATSIFCATDPSVLDNNGLYFE